MQASGGADGWGSAPQDGRFRVRFLFRLSAFGNPGVHSASNKNDKPKHFPGGKVGLSHGAKSYAVLVVPNFKVRMEAQRSVPLCGFMTCY